MYNFSELRVLFIRDAFFGVVIWSCRQVYKRFGG